MTAEPQWNREIAARIRWATRRLLVARFGERLRAHDAARPPEADRAAVRSWTARGLHLHAEIHGFAAGIHAEIERLAASGELDVEALEAVLEAAREWPAEGKP